MKKARTILVLASAAIAAVASAALAATSITPPPSVASAGKVVFCSDLTYPPEESLKGSTPVGSDIDIASGITKLMGVKAVFRNTSFDSIFTALTAKKCDAIISGISDTAERRKAFEFVDYLKIGESLMVRSGNPAKIATLSDLSGKSVSVQVGTAHTAFLRSASAKLVKQGRKPMVIRTYAQDSAAAAALKSGKVDAYFGDSPVVVYDVSHDRSLAIAGKPIDATEIGIAVRRGDPLRAAAQKALDVLYANGTVRRIVAKWGMSNAATLLK